MPRARSTRLRWFRERGILAGLVLCGVATVAVTGLIVFILARETSTFFGQALTPTHGDPARTVEVSLGDFFGDLTWSPNAPVDARFGIWPLIGGTLQVAGVAMAFAIPFGLMSAIWLSEYAPARVRAVLKPVLEIIAGVPTVVFGFFALTVITPALQMRFWQVPEIDPSTGQPLLGADGQPLTAPLLADWVSGYNALAAGLAVGVMCLPIVTSLTEDALRAVPRALREGSYGMGASRFETATRVVFPAALSGVVAACLLAVARAVGETMIVAIAAGASALALSDRGPGRLLALGQDTQTMTGFLVQVFKGDIAHGGVAYQACYAVALTLFVMTLFLTVLGGVIRQRFGQRYE
ncbi:MAG: phosphate ABC transporter permease subunit PstC [Planctomycetota bacterium]